MTKNVCMFVWNHFTNDARVLREATALVEYGYEVDLICIHDTELADEEVINGFTVKRVKRYPTLYYKITSLRKILSTLKKQVLSNKILLLFMAPLILLLLPLLISYNIFRLISKKLKLMKIYILFSIFARMVYIGLQKDYDVYHSHDLNTLLQGYICKLLKRKKLIYDSHEVQTSRTGYVGKRYYYLEKFLIKKIDKMIMTTNTRADYTAKKYDIEKPAVVHNYSFLKTPEKHSVNLYKLLDIPPHEPILLYQGGIQEGRGLEKIVDAIPKIKTGIVVFIGDGKIKGDLIKRCIDAKVDHRVRFLSKVPVEELPNYTQNAYLGFQVLQNICFNHYSALSNKLFEYIMAEVPVVACDLPEIKRVVEGEQVGVVIDAHYSDKIAHAVNNMIENQAQYQDFKEGCIKAKFRYNWDSEKHKLYEIYTNLLGGDKNVAASR